MSMSESVLEYNNGSFNIYLIDKDFLSSLLLTYNTSYSGVISFLKGYETVYKLGDMLTIPSTDYALREILYDLLVEGVIYKIEYKHILHGLVTIQIVDRD